MLKSLFQYASRKRDEGVYDFTKIMESFYHETLVDVEGLGKGNNLTRRLTKMIKEYVATDPRHQCKIDQF